jgi:DNA-binding beta-propeller fold protein YncE
VTGGVPAGLDVDTRSGRFYIADGSGVVWTTDAPNGAHQSTLGAPFNINPALPRDLAVDQTTGSLYVAASGCAAQSASRATGCVLILDGGNGSRRAVVPLDGEPGAVRIDSDLGLLYVSVPSRQAIEVVDVRSGSVLPTRTLLDMPQVTSLAMDAERHLLYVGHLGGQVSVIDTAASQLLQRPSLTDAGLSSVAAARGQAYAINTATHELAVLNPAAGEVTRYLLSQEPAAVAASEDTGAVYVLSSRASIILRIDPTDGSEIGRVTLPARSGHVGQMPSNDLTMRPRLALDAFNDTIFATLPEAGTLAAVASDQFPEIAREIPMPDDADAQVTVAADIPAVLRPSAPFGSAFAEGPATSH